jgi:hypothetical protein
MIDKDGCAVKLLNGITSIGHQATAADKDATVVDRRKLVAG